jgi:hypothetical protein
MSRNRNPWFSLGYLLGVAVRTAEESPPRQIIPISTVGDRLRTVV